MQLILTVSLKVKLVNVYIKEHQEENFCKTFTAFILQVISVFQLAGANLAHRQVNPSGRLFFVRYVCYLCNAENACFGMSYFCTTVV